MRVFPAEKKIKINHNPLQVADGAHCIITDTWQSMGDKKSISEEMFLPFQVNKNIIKHAQGNAIFMHCLPVGRGEEVTDEIIDGKKSVVWRKL